MASRAITTPYIPLERRIAFKKMKGEQRRKWLEEQHRRNPRCRYCGLTTELKPRDYANHADHGISRHATLDHIEPRGAGGADNSSNWALACAICNNLKADMPEREFKAMLREEGILA